MQSRRDVIVEPRTEVLGTSDKEGAESRRDGTCASQRFVTWGRDLAYRPEHNARCMSHSYPNILVHCVFSTRERRRIIPDDLQEKLWRYLAGIGAHHKISVLECGGIADHIHILLVLPSDTTLSKAVQVLKANSSRWLGEHGIEFAWQEGYAAFSVSASQASSVREYIQKQATHHQRRNFEEEFIALLAKSGVSYDPHHVFG